MGGPFLPGLDFSSLDAVGALPVAEDVSPEDQLGAMGVAPAPIEPAPLLAPTPSPAPVVGIPPMLARPPEPALAARAPAPNPQSQPQPSLPQSLVPASRTSSRRTTRVQSPRTARDRQLEREQDSIVRHQAELEQRKVPILQERAQIAAQEQQERAQIAQQKQEATQAVRNEIESEIGRRQAQDSADIERMNAMRDETFWGDSTGRRVAGALAVALGTFGSALTGGRNTALDIIDRNIARWRQDREARIRQVADQIERRTKSSQLAVQALMQGLDMLDKQLIAARERMAATAAASLARQGVPMAQIQQDERVLALQQQATQLRQAREDKHREQLQTVSDQITERINLATQRGPSTVINVGADGSGAGAAAPGSDDPGGVFDILTGEKLASLGPKRAKAADDVNRTMALGAGLQKDLRNLIELTARLRPSGSGTFAGAVKGVIADKKAQLTDSEDLSRLRAISARAISTLNKIQKFGALSETEIELLKVQLGMANLTKEAAMASIRETLQSARRNMLTELGSKGLRGQSLLRVVDRVLPESLYAGLGEDAKSPRARRRGARNTGRRAQGAGPSGFSEAARARKLAGFRAALERSDLTSAQRARVEQAISVLEGRR